jgi:hypothetical protein
VATKYYELPSPRDLPGILVTDRRLVPSLLLVGGAVWLLAMSLSAQQSGTAIMWGSVALAAYCLGLLLMAAMTAGHDGLGLASWKIGPWSLAWVCVTFGLVTISWSTPQSGSEAQIALPSVLSAIWLMAVAMTMFATGYCAGPRRLGGRYAARLVALLDRRFSGDIRSPLVPWMLFAIGAAAQLASTATTGRFGYVGDAAAVSTTASGYGQVLGIAALCGPLAVAAAAVRAYRNPARGAWFTLAVLFVVEIAIGAASGGKESYIVATLAVLIPRAAARRRLPLIVIVTAILLFLLVIIPFNQVYRSNARGTVTLSVGQAVAAAPSILHQVISADRSPSVIVRSVTYLAQRIREIDGPAIIMQRTPSQIPYSSPAQLAEAPVADLIPRALWPGKPILATGYQFSQQYYELTPEVYTSSAITPEGDLYRHGGWIPLVAGMLLLGCGARVLDDVLDVRASAHAAFLVILAFPALVKAEDDWISLLAGLPGLVVLWLAVVMFSFARRPRVA